MKPFFQKVEKWKRWKSEKVVIWWRNEGTFLPITCFFHDQVIFCHSQAYLFDTFRSTFWYFQAYLLILSGLPFWYNPQTWIREQSWGSFPQDTGWSWTLYWTDQNHGRSLQEWSRDQEKGEKDLCHHRTWGCWRKRSRREDHRLKCWSISGPRVGRRVRDRPSQHCWSVSDSVSWSEWLSL